MKKLLYLFLVFGLFACSSDSADDDSNNSNPCPNQPQLITYEVSNIDYDENTDLSSATFTAEIQNIQLGPDCETFSITNQGFVYGTNIQPTTSDNVANANGQNASVTLNDLATETTYYVRSYLTNLLGTFYGNEVSFTTPQSTIPIYLAENGVTVKAKDWAEVGMTAVINGTTYTVVDFEMLNQVLANYNAGIQDIHPNTCVTTFITSLCNNAASAGGAANAWNCNSEEIFYWESFQNVDISSWDVSNVTSMKGLFGLHHDGQGIRWSNFNNDISLWDVSNVEYFAGMFYMNLVFNQDLDNWTFKDGADLSWMFAAAYAFNGNISSWDVSNVVNMSGMFYSYGDGFIWNSVNFGNFAFNQDLSSWDFSSVTNMSQMFYNHHSFNQDLSSWNVDNVVNMSFMFSAALSFNQDLSSWDVNNVTECEHFCTGAGDWALPKPDFTNCSQDIGCD